MSPKKPQNTAEKLVQRPPVVVIMGHIDHGKSTLLDYIRKTKVVEGEAGGITQHLGAYEAIQKTAGGERTITFLDTPGHEAFSAIRERGARIADIAILVVSAEDGVKPQTLEALKNILAEKIPFIVAINKIDKPGANIEVTKQNLAENEVYVEGYGGDVPVVPISALKGTGISDLLDMIILVADLQDLKADPEKLAEGGIIEAGLDSKKGIYATLLIKNGTLKSGMAISAEDAFSPVRILEDYQGNQIKSATFSSPVRVIGFNKMPAVGAAFTCFESKKDAENAAESFVPSAKKDSGFDTSMNSDGSTIIIPLIIKADAIGSLEGIRHELKKMKDKTGQDKVKIKIISEGIGSINESDVKTAQGDANIIILSFNAKPDSKAKSILEHSPVPIRVESFDVIYNLIEFVRNLIVSKIPKEYIDEISGTAKVLALFSKTKDKQILGGKVQQGTLILGSEVKILRRDAEIGRGKVKELQKQKVKTDEVGEGFEFGSLIESKIEIAVGDKIQGFKTVEKGAQK